MKRLTILLLFLIPLACNGQNCKFGDSIRDYDFETVDSLFRATQVEYLNCQRYGVIYAIDNRKELKRIKCKLDAIEKRRNFLLQ